MPAPPECRPRVVLQENLLVGARPGPTPPALLPRRPQRLCLANHAHARQQLASPEPLNEPAQVTHAGRADLRRRLLEWVSIQNAASAFFC